MRSFPAPRKWLAPVVIVFGLLAIQAQAAIACGGLVAPNGAIRLSRATTLVAWHDGVERYMTSFTYQDPSQQSGSTPVNNLGWIVPLPAVPLKIEEGGAWTLQRLFRETHPIERSASFAGAAAPQATNADVQVLQQVKVEALNITVLRGSGQGVLDWCAANGFTVDGDTRAHLLVYAQGSPIFMAAKYDTSAARAQHLTQGDGSPVLITMRTAHIWVPFEVLALDGQRVQADLYLLTDEPVNTSEFNAAIGESAVGREIPGAPGFTVNFQERMNGALYHDLSTDRNMGWVRPDGWLTYLSLDAPNTAVTYDLGVTDTGVIKLARFGTAPMQVGDAVGSRGLSPAWLRLPLGTPEVALTAAIFLAIAGTVLLALWASGRVGRDRQAVG